MLKCGDRSMVSSPGYIFKQDGIFKGIEGTLYLSKSLSNVRWWHSLIWWLQDYFPYDVNFMDKKKEDIYYKSFRCKFLALKDFWRLHKNLGYKWDFDFEKPKHK